MRGMIVVLAVFALAACEGPTGPEGPQGPEGPEGAQGAEGPGTRITFTGEFDEEGEAAITLPSEAGDGSDLPVIGCYESSDGQTWLVVADGWDATDATYCAVSEGDGGNLIVVFSEGVPEWFYFLSVVY